MRREGIELVMARGAWVGLLVSNTVHAAPGTTSPPVAPTEAIRVEFAGPPVCGDKAAFFRAVRARTDRVRPSEDGARERRFSVRIATSALGFEGVLAVIEPGGESSERQVSAENCAELVDALSVIAALAIAPDTAQTGALPPSSSASPDAPDTEPLPAASTPAPVAETPPSLPTASSAAPRDDLRHDGPPLPLSWFVGTGVGVDIVTPRGIVLPTGAIDLDVGLERASLFSPSLRVSVRRSLEATTSAPSGYATFTLSSVRVEGCPLQLRASPALRFLPCAVIDGGVLEAAGHDVTGAQSHARPWWTTGLAGRVSLGAGSLRVDVEAGVVVPLFRDTFRFCSDRGEVLLIEVAGWTTRSQRIYPVGVNHVHFSPTDASVLVGGADGRAYVYDAVTFEERLLIDPTSTQTAAASFSPDGHLLATTSQNNALEIRDATSGARLQTLSGHEAYVSDIIWVSQDRIVTNDWAGVIRSWTRDASDHFAASGGWMTKGHSTGIAVSPDLTSLAVSTTDTDPNVGGFVFLPL